MWHVDLLSSPANRFRGPKAHVPTTFAMQHEHSRRLECPRRALAQLDGQYEYCCRSCISGIRIPFTAQALVLKYQIPELHHPVAHHLDGHRNFIRSALVYLRHQHFR